jgi:hypothetical protein
MKSEIKTQLLSALRSQTYIKTEGRLFERVGGVDRHCSLGVLCDLAYKADVEGVEFDPNDSNLEHYGEIPSDRVMPRAVYEWAGLSLDEAVQIFLTNDSRDTGRDFPLMADWIEENIPTGEGEG